VKRYLVMAAGVVVLVSMLAVAAFAESQIKLFVNGGVIKMDPSPQVVDGRAMAPVRAVAEALGATVRWEENNKSIFIDAPDLASLQRQVRMLQAAVAPGTPREAAETWARGVKERNGALQHAVLSPELKEKSRMDYEYFGWVTGTSSPWAERYEIASEENKGDGTWEFEIRFEMATSTGPAGTSVHRVAVGKFDRAFYVSRLFSEEGVAAQLKTEIESYLNRKYGRHYQIVDTEVGLVSKSVGNGRAEAVFLAKVTHTMGSADPSQWPPQKGRIRYLEENRANLSSAQVSLIEEKINFWDQELRQYIGKNEQSNEFLKITADFDYRGVVSRDSVKLFYEDPAGAYLPVREEEWPAFKTAEELEKEGYQEMSQLAGN